MSDIKEIMKDVKKYIKENQISIDMINGNEIIKKENKILKKSKSENTLNSQIKTIEVFNDVNKFEIQINELLHQGYKILSTNCGGHGYESSIDIWYQAILKI